MNLVSSIEISEIAHQQLAQLGVGGDKFLRINIVPGGCSGMTYTAAIDTVISDKDSVVWQNDNFRVVADSGSIIFLDGLQIDYSNDLIQAGFRFKNPNASKSCGCGSSFSA